MSAPDRLSRLPVGSSAKTIAGRADERAGDRHALALAAGELRRVVRQPVAEPDPLEHLARPLAALAGRRARVEQAGGDVLQRAHPVEQEELLEDEADLARPQRRQRAVAEPRDVLAGDRHRARASGARACP